MTNILTAIPQAVPATVLIADDEEANRKMLASMLRRDGYHILLAKDGQEADELFASAPVDLALLDVRMPVRTGFELCRAIKGNPKTRLIPVVLITGLSSTNDRIAGIQCGADDFLSKPVSREELSARVRSLLLLKQFTDELDSAETVLFSLARSIEAKDPYTEGHCARLSKYSVDLAKALGLPEDQHSALRRAGVVHDIGKIGVPDIFDTSRYAHDPRSDFMNSSLVDTRTFDYAADAWGYTVGGAIEWYTGPWTFRGSVFDLSIAPNTTELDPHFGQFRSERRDRAALFDFRSARQGGNHRIPDPRQHGQL